jgi:hypothetical protein
MIRGSAMPGRQFAKSTTVVVPPNTHAFEITSGGAARRP